MNLTRLVAPDMPVTLAEVKTHCRISHDAEDDYLSLLLGAAHTYCEHYCQRSFGEQTLLGQFRDFPNQLPFPPAVSVNSVKYYSDDVLITMSPADYRLDLSMPSRVVIDNVPAVDTRPDAVQIEWISGKDASENVKLASLIMVAHWYRLREPVVLGSVSNVPFSAHALIDREKWGAY